jgi:hypothetical protein
MSNYQEESIEDRLAKRRRLRNKRLLKQNTVDESEITVINHSSTTQALERKSTATSSDRHKSSTIAKTFELPSIEKSHLKQTEVISNHQIHSTPLQLQVTENQYSITDNQTQNSSHQDEKPVILKEIVPTKKSQLILPNLHTPQDEKPVILKEIVSTKNSQPILPNLHTPQDEKPVINRETILPPTTSEKWDSISREIRGHSTPNQIKTSEDYPQSTIDHPILHSKPLTRPISQQIVSMTTKYKHQQVGSIFAKQNSLALPYLFNKRLINAELARTSSLDFEQLSRKTVWD